MRYLFTLACLLLVTATVADEPEFDFGSVAAKKAFRDYNKAVAKDKADAAKLAQKRRDAFVESLERALKQSMQAGNLEEANKIDAAIKGLEKGVSKALEKGAKSKRLDNQRPKVPSLVGVWKPAPDAGTAFIIRPNGTCYSVGAKLEGTWRPADKKDHRFVIRWGARVGRSHYG